MEPWRVYMCCAEAACIDLKPLLAASPALEDRVNTLTPANKLAQTTAEYFEGDPSAV